jgi:sugar lactone lactonase YvrE/enterochelin esterase-like enzyme
MQWIHRAAAALQVSVLASGIAMAQDNDYRLGPDSQFNPAVPHGKVTHFTLTAAAGSVFPGTVRDVWVYAPPGHDGSSPAALMVFQDGGGYVSTNGPWRVPWVFDNLIARGAMPPAVGVFVNPGIVPSVRGTNALPRYNRSLEYDGLGGDYAAFLQAEVLPAAAERARVTITSDPNLRAIGGASSGAIAAFTAAWERPDLFRRVFSTIGTYVGLRGGNDYPTLVRKFEPRPIKVFLQDGYNDLNIYGGNWWVANQDMYSALAWAGYDVAKEWGTGGHDSKQGSAILPKALTWLWAGAPGPVPSGHSTNSPVGQATIPGAGWELVGQGYQLPAGLCVAADGSVYFTDGPTGRVFRVGPDGSASMVRQAAEGTQALAVAPDGALVAAQPDGRRLVRLEGKSEERYLATDTGVKDVVVGSSGMVYFTDPSARAIKRINGQGQVDVLDTGIEFPAGLCLVPDQTLLLVSDMVGQFVYSFQIQPDGSLAHRQRYHHLHLADDPRGSGADGMCVDGLGRLWVATTVGVQFCDQAGRVNGILAKPEPDAWATDVCLGGKNLDELYLAAGDKVWRRKVRARGVLPQLAPVVPPPPRL